MNSNNASFIVVGTATLVLGGVIGYFISGVRLASCPAPPTADKARYVLYFGDCGANPDLTRRVTVSNRTAFQNAIDLQPVNFISVTIKETENGGITSITAPTVNSTATLKSVIHVAQQRNQGNPCTLHVTQKVGLDNPDQVQAVLAALKPEQ